MKLTANYKVRRLPDRVKEVWWPGVDGHGLVNLGKSLYEITQSGVVDLTKDLIYQGGQDEANRIFWEHDPDVQSGKKLIAVDTMDGRVFRNCRLVNSSSENIPGSNPQMMRYENVWRQVQPGIGTYTPGG